MSGRGSEIDPDRVRSGGICKGFTGRIELQKRRIETCSKIKRREDPNLLEARASSIRV
jgi:hypothetical protein